MTADGSLAYVDTPSGLDALTQAIGACDHIAVDTEFIREKTYYPALCLIQIATDGTIWCVDPLAIDDSRGAACCADGFVAARRSFTLHARTLSCSGTPSSICRRPCSTARSPRPCSVGPIRSRTPGSSRKSAGITLDKSSSRTDWSKRPLSARQLDYAASDVRHLDEIRRALSAELEAAGRLHWFEEECRRLEDPALYAAEPAEAWRRLKGIEKLEPRSRRVAAGLAAWREQHAQKRDLPRGWVLKDDRLLARSPASGRARYPILTAIDGIAPGLVRRHGDTLLRVIRSPPDDVADGPARPPRFTKAGKALLARILADLRERAADERVAMGLVASRREIERAIAGDTALRLFEGWRDDVFGRHVRDRLADSTVAERCE